MNGLTRESARAKQRMTKMLAVLVFTGIKIALEICAKSPMADRH